MLVERVVVVVALEVIAIGSYKRRSITFGSSSGKYNQEGSRGSCFSIRVVVVRVVVVD